MKIGIIGCGNMGQALLRGIIAKGYISRRNIFVADQDRTKTTSARLKFKVRTVRSNSELIKTCGVVILAVKPQDVDMVLRNVTVSFKGKLLISICAGISARKLEKQIGRVAVVRVMPNMPVVISQGISAISSGSYATARHRKTALSIFSCLGEVVEVSERLMDAVTAISGSGPAYFFYLAERMIAAAEALGLSHSIAKRLVIKTALGSVLLMNQSKENPQILRKRVSSRGGTTEAAFKVFKKDGLDKILAQAFKAAAKRAQELEAEK